MRFKTWLRFCSVPAMVLVCACIACGESLPKAGAVDEAIRGRVIDRFETLLVTDIDDRLPVGVKEVYTPLTGRWYLMRDLC